MTSGAKVEVDDVAPAMGEHHDILRRALPDPVGDESLQCHRVAVRDGDSVVSSVGGEGCAWISVAQTGGRTAFPLVDLAAVLGEVDRWAPACERAKGAAGIDRIELAVVADQHELALGGVDRVRQRCESASAGHARLVDDEHGPGLQRPVLELNEQGADARARDPGAVLKLAGSAPCDSGAADGDARGAPGVGARPQREGLAGTGYTDDDDDPVSATGQSANGRALFVGERRSSAVGEAKRLGVGDGPTGAAPSVRQFYEAALGGQ